MITVRPVGIAQAAKNLETLSRLLQTSIVRASVRSAINVIAKPIKTKTYSQDRHRITGLLMASQAVGVTKNGQVITGRLRMRDVNIASQSRVAKLVRTHRRFAGPPPQKYRAFYWWFLERGTRRGLTARPWVVPTFDATSTAALDDFSIVLRTRLDSETANLPKGATP